MYEEWATSSDQKALEDKLTEVIRNTATKDKVPQPVDTSRPAPVPQCQSETKLQRKKRLAEDCFVEYALHLYVTDQYSQC